MAERSTREQISSLRPDLPGVEEVLHATFVDHEYPSHCHDVWTVLIIDDGAVVYDLAGRARGADRSLVSILPPFVAHDGRSASPGRSFRKRVLYLDAPELDERLIGRAVDRSSIRDRRLRTRIAALHRTFERPVDDLEPETILNAVIDDIARRLDRLAPPAPPRTSEAADALKALLDEHPFHRHRLADAAARLGWTENHLIRSFTGRFGLAPHRYLISRRVDGARRLLLDGMAPADAATTVGFYDQAHLNRHFTTHVGTTPGRFARLGSGPATHSSSC